jgi:predicted enzyme related to lactoylglutathione lyase
MQFNGILIGSDDPTRLIEYYTKVLGEPGYADSSYSTWILGSGSMSVGPHSEVHGSNPQPGRLIWNIETPDVQQEFDRMKAAGAIVVREPYSFEGFPDSRIATLADPDDNYFQLMTPFDPESMGS